MSMAVTIHRVTTMEISTHEYIDPELEGKYQVIVFYDEDHNEVGKVSIHFNTGSDFLEVIKAEGAETDMDEM